MPSGGSGSRQNRMPSGAGPGSNADGSITAPTVAAARRYLGGYDANRTGGRPAGAAPRARWFPPGGRPRGAVAVRDAVVGARDTVAGARGGRGAGAVRGRRGRVPVPDVPGARAWPGLGRAGGRHHARCRVGVVRVVGARRGAAAVVRRPARGRAGGGGGRGAGG